MWAQPLFIICPFQTYKAQDEDDERADSGRDDSHEILSTPTPSPVDDSPFARLARLAAETHHQQEESTMSKSDEDETDEYMKRFARKQPPKKVNVIEFWKERQIDFPWLSILALYLQHLAENRKRDLYCSNQSAY